MILSSRIDTPIGPLVLLAREGILLMLEFEDAEPRIEREMNTRFRGEGHQPTDDPFGLASRIRSYFAGDLSAIEGSDTDGGGTEFQKRVWAELKRIPCRVTISYAELARRLGDPKAVRAVGTANGRNPIAIVVLCHRVIGADGSLTGYGGGLHRKRWLLVHEGALLDV
ncbi:MAG: methylated-DNA--[protein]-cysteine S-methyltransferase [Aestuariivirga sp.]|uniref:methylated-DNA--[protein]-cysteine S-methyltransferase n=1 Tax=Aestuariivirga sp. TaxID=2650926 RepID=UPI003015AD16